jgi:hypothetical protein
MSDDLCDRLTALSRSEHSDMSVAAEAVEEIGRLKAALAMIGRMSPLPDDGANRMTLVAAHKIARDALAGNGKR